MNNLSFSQIMRTLRGRWKLCLITFFLIVGTAAVITAMMTKKYKATATILLDFRGVDPVSGSNLPSQLLPGYLATQLDVMSSMNVALKAVDALGIDKVPVIQEEFMRDTEGRGSVKYWAAQLLLKYIKLEPSRESSVVGISYMSPDPQFSAAVANAFANGYIRTNLELKVDPAKETSAWYDDQLKTLKTNLEKAQNKLSAYQQAHGIVATDERVDAENSRLQELSGQLVVAQTQTYDAQAKQQQIDEVKTRGGRGSAPDVLANPVVQRLKGEIVQTQARLSDLSSTVGANHPQVQTMNEHLQSLNRQLEAEMGTIASGVRNVSGLAKQREGSIKAALDAQKTRLLDLKKQRAEMVVLLGEAESAQRAYDAGMQRLTQTRLESKLSQTNIAIVEPAVEPLYPSRPRWLLNMVLAIIIGGNAAIGLALMRESSDRRIRSEGDLLEAVPAPLLGELVSARVRPKRLALLPSLRLLGRSSP